MYAIRSYYVSVRQRKKAVRHAQTATPSVMRLNRSAACLSVSRQSRANAPVLPVVSAGQDARGASVAVHQNVAQLVHVLQRLAGAQRDAGQRIVRDRNGETRFLV